MASMTLLIDLSTSSDDNIKIEKRVSYKLTIIHKSIISKTLAVEMDDVRTVNIAAEEIGV